MSVKTYNGSSWVESFKYYNNGTWEDLNVYTGDEWISTDALPFKSDLSSLYSERSGLDMIEENGGDNATILPSSLKVDDTNYATKVISDFATNDLSGFVEAEVYYLGTGSLLVFDSSDINYTTRYFSINIEAGRPTMRIREASTGVNNVVLTVDAITEGKYKIKWESTGSSYSISINDIPVSIVVSTGVDDGKWIGDVGYSSIVRDNICIGRRITTGETSSVLGYINYVNYNNTNLWITTGIGKYVYDLIGGVHLDNVGSDYIHYHSNGSQYMLNNGYSLYSKDTEVDEYVPYYNGSPVDVGSILSTYDLTINVDGAYNVHNMAPSLINIPSSEFDRSNVTIYNSDARNALEDYDASNPNRWLMSNIVDPRAYYEWRNVGYKGKIGIRTNYIDQFNRIDKIYSYVNDKLGSDQYSIMKYNRVDLFALKSGEEVVYDGDNYVVLI